LDGELRYIISLNELIDIFLSERYGATDERLQTTSAYLSLISTRNSSFQLRKAQPASREHLPSAWGG
jgi:hypothetical protein